MGVVHQQVHTLTYGCIHSGVLAAQFNNAIAWRKRPLFHLSVSQLTHRYKIVSSKSITTVGDGEPFRQAVTKGEDAESVRKPVTAEQNRTVDGGHGEGMTK